MQFDLKNPMVYIVALVTLSGAVSVYSSSRLDATPHPIARVTAHVVSVVKIENISLDYAKEHAALMRKPDDSASSTF